MLMLAIAPTSFVAPAASVTAHRVPAAEMVSTVTTKSFTQLAEIPGGIAPLGVWDPLGFCDAADPLEINRLREAELAHGRVGMLASAGFLVQEKFHPLFSGDGGPAIEQIPKLPPYIWALMTIGIGIAESTRIQAGWANPYTLEASDVESISSSYPAKIAGGAQLKKDTAFQRLRPDYVPGNLGFDPLGLAPEGLNEFRAMQEKELSHGRLGMLAAAGFMAQEAITGQTWGTFWGDASF